MSPLAMLHTDIRAADVPILLLTFGSLLLFVECIRPGRVLPGAAGLLLLLLGIHNLASLPLRSAALLLLTAALALLLAGAYRPLRWICGVLGTAALMTALPLLVRTDEPGPSQGTTPWLGAGAGLVLGACSSLLLQIAAKARANKHASVHGRAAAHTRPISPQE